MEVVPQAEARNISNVQEALSNGNFFNSASQVAVEKISCLFSLDICVIQPTFGNENRSFEPVGNPSNYNLTLNYIDELKANFTIFPQVNNVRIEINGTQLVTVTLDNANVTEGGGGDWIYIGALNINRIEVNQRTNFTIYFPQNDDTAFTTHGRSLEGNFLNNLTTDQEEIFYNYLEFYEPNSKILGEIIPDIKNDQQRAYEIIGKINTTGFYTPNANLEAGAGFYKDLYLNSTSITEFYNNLLQKVNDTKSQVVPFPP